MSQDLENRHDKTYVTARLIQFGLVVLAAALLYGWLTGDPTAELTLRLPGADNAPQNLADTQGPVKLRGTLLAFDGVPANLPGTWPRFRGPNFNGISTEKIDLAGTWPADGPRLLWSIDLGQGYAGAAVLAGRVYVLDYDHENKADAVRCLSLEDGSEIWRYSYPVKVKRYHGMSRTVPAVTDKYIVTLGPKCHVTCLDSVTGQFRWMLNLVREFNTTVPQWYAGQCPLIDDGKAIIAPGGDALMIAVDCQTGEIIWQTPNPNHWKMTHSSIMPMQFNGTRMYVYCASGGVVGISAEDGSILWETSDWKIRIANVPSPVIAGPDLIFLTGGYNAGSMMLQLIDDTGKLQVNTLYRLKAEVFGAEQHTPILFDGHIYGVRQDKQMVCLDLAGNVLWTSSAAKKFGLGPFIITNGLIYAMNDSGLLTLIEATPNAYIQLAEAKVLEGPDSWGPMATASGRLILRDLNRMICLDVTEY